MTRWKILIPMETASREMLYKVNLIEKLTKLNFDCYLGEKQEIYKLFSKVKPFIYLDKGYHKNVSENIYKNIEKYNGKIVSLDEEGGVDYSDFRTINQRYPEVLFEHAHLVFIWGKKQYDFLKKSRYSLGKSIISGHPRFEMLHKNYWKFYSNEINSIKNKYKKFIFITGNSSLGNNIKGDEFIYKNYSNRIKNLSNIIKFDREKNELLTSFAIALSKQVSITIIFRPHPEEDLTYYTNKFNNIENIVVTNKYSAIPWIISSDFMVHPDCTTGVESIMLGKKTYSLLPYYDKDLVTETPILASEVFYDKDQLIKKITAGISKINADSLRVLSDYFSFYQETLSIISKNIHALTNDYSFQDTKDLNINIKYKFKTLIYTIAKKIYIFSILNNKNKRFSIQKKGEFNIYNLTKIVHKTNEFNKNIKNNKLRIRKINSGLYFFKNRDKF